MQQHIRKAIMPTLRPNPENLQSRYNILDMMAVVFIAALVASLWPVENPNQRVVVLFAALGLSAASGWWTATLIHTFKMKGPWKRIGLHLYAFFAFASFLVVVIGGIISFVMVFDNWDRSFARAASLTLVCLFPTASIFYLENVRQKVEKGLIDEGLGAPPIDAAANAAQTNLKKLRDAKKNAET